jgi:hypothetical protein
MKIGVYSCRGPFDSPEDLREDPGLYAVVQIGSTDTCTLAEVSYSRNVRRSAELFLADRAGSQRDEQVEFKLGVIYAGEDEHSQLEATAEELRNQHMVSCVL